MSEIKAVLWDLDSTLIDFHIPERNAIIRCFEDFNLGPCPEEFLTSYHDVNIKWWDRLEKGLMTRDRIIVGRFEEMLETFGYDASIAGHFNENYMNRLGDMVCPIPGAIEVLSTLHGKVLQAIATNGIVKTQQKKISNSGFAQYIDKIYISGLLGADKPSVEFFNKILEDLQDLKKNEILMVGDSLTSDMKGANNAGIMCCWFNPEHKSADPSLKIDYVISDLMEILEVVK